MLIEEDYVDKYLLETSDETPFFVLFTGNRFFV